MAQKRMIDKKISVSEQVANLPVEAQLIYTWAIPHADDIGLLPSSLRTLKATVIPMIDMPIDVFEKNVAKIVEERLWEIYEYMGQKYYRVPNFTRYQTLKKDRQPQVLIPFDYDVIPSKSWAKLSELGFQMEDNGFQMEPEVKRSEVKRSEEKENTPHTQKPFKDSFGEFSKVKLTADEHSKLVEKLGERNLGILITELDGYIESKGKRYSSHYATILNWARRKFQEHFTKQAMAKPKMV